MSNNSPCPKFTWPLPSGKKPPNPIILVVEDNDAVRQMLEIALRGFGFSVRLASGGKKAIEIYRAEVINLVLMDVQLPDLNGPETLAALKKIDPNVVCYFMTAYAGKHTWQDLQDAVAVLEKPFHLEDLRQLIFRNVS